MTAEIEPQRIHQRGHDISRGGLSGRLRFWEKVELGWAKESNVSSSQDFEIGLLLAQGRTEEVYRILEQLRQAKKLR